MSVSLRGSLAHDQECVLTEAKHMEAGTIAARPKVEQMASLPKSIVTEDPDTSATVTGDTNPVHPDHGYARETRLGGQGWHCALFRHNK